MQVFFTYQQLQIVSRLEELQEIETLEGRLANVSSMQTTSEPFSGINGNIETDLSGPLLYLTF